MTSRQGFRAVRHRRPDVPPLRPIPRQSPSRPRFWSAPSPSRRSGRESRPPRSVCSTATSRSAPASGRRIRGRFGDSWAARVGGRTARGAWSCRRPTPGSTRPSTVQAPAPTNSKWSLSARWSRAVAGHPVYGLIEWARTSEAGGFFVFRSVLAEGAWTAGPHRLQYRFERTERPEEERVSAFRSLRPHLENSILGTTRWTIHTLGYEVEASGGGRIQSSPAGGGLGRNHRQGRAVGCSTSRACTAEVTSGR